MIKKGRYDWYAPEKTMSEAARSVFNHVSNLKDLPHLPSMVMEIQQTLERITATPREIAMAIKREPFIAVQVLKIAERLRLTRNPINPPIKALEHAIVYIGYKSLGDILITAALHGMSLPKSGFKAEDFWQECYLTGMIAEFLMKRLGFALVADEVFLAGSLCNLGKLVTALCFPPLATKITRDVHSPQTLLSWRKAEQRYNFPEHTVLGEIAACLWGLPDYVMLTACRHHEVPGNRRWPHAELTEVTAAANQLAHVVMMEPHRVEPEVLDGFMRMMQLTEKELSTITAEFVSFHHSVASGL